MNTMTQNAIDAEHRPEADAAEAVRRPAFMVASERSGTTLLRLMLDHHPQIAWMGDLNYAVDLLPEAGGYPDIRAYHAWLRHNRIFLDDNWKIDESLAYPELVNTFLLQKKGRKKVVGAAVHHHFARLLRLWPAARFIHLLRDGRDVAKSCIGMGWYGNMYTAVDRWVQAEKWWDELRPRLLPRQWIEVKYEELIADPPEGLGRICEFLGVPYDPAMLDYATDSTYERPDPKLVYQWKKKQTREDVQLAESRIGPLLASRGYELSGYPPLRVTPEMERDFRRQCRAARRRFRLERYGYWNILGESLTRRLGLAPLHRHFQKRIDVITNKHRK